MGRHKHKSMASRNFAYEAGSLHAENNVAASSSRNRNQKGHTPNNPSTG
ncbi:hypothetical protein M6D81_05435 [Paenibacillus sp. J5C_2022]|uniref:Uncharacterized protein n=1 Tax=Paenibacillus chungangensis TaxID=696535 RepID=A0ABW3HN93_9BACL|nr:hypothetical protein [Paenibacillus sp. J5C2022]MCU6708148.1 hypothetical protein [Paenibacillus sp. J5C2022]